MLLFCLSFWAITYLADGKGAVEPLFVTTGGALLGIGQAAQALGELRHPPPEPPTIPQANPKPDGGE
jgi:hypothetical protein